MATLDILAMADFCLADSPSSSLTLASPTANLSLSSLISLSLPALALMILRGKLIAERPEIDFFPMCRNAIDLKIPSVIQIVSPVSNVIPGGIQPVYVHVIKRYPAFIF